MQFHFPTSNINFKSLHQPCYGKLENNKLHYILYSCYPEEDFQIICPYSLIPTVAPSGCHVVKKEDSTLHQNDSKSFWLTPPLWFYRIFLILFNIYSYIRVELKSPSCDLTKSTGHDIKATPILNKDACKWFYMLSKFDTREKL